MLPSNHSFAVQVSDTLETGTATLLPVTDEELGAVDDEEAT